MNDEKYEFAQLQARANLMTAMFSHISSDHEELHINNNIIRNELDVLRFEYNRKAEKLSSANIRIEELELILARTKSDLNVIESAYQKVIKSFSWRITAPIRWVREITKT